MRKAILCSPIILLAIAACSHDEHETHTTVEKTTTISRPADTGYVAPDATDTTVSEKTTTYKRHDD